MQLYQLALIMGMLAAALAVVVGLALRGRGRASAAPPAARPARHSRENQPEPQVVQAASPAAAATDKPAERRRKLPTMTETEAAESPAAENRVISFSEDIFSKLEQAFEAYQRHSISLETYSSMVMAEREAVERHIHGLRAKLRGAEPSEQEAQALTDGERAREAVRWCIDWAYEQTQERQAANG